MHTAEGEFVVTAFGVDGTRRQGFSCRLVDPSAQAIVCVSQEVAGGLSEDGQLGGIGSGVNVVPVDGGQDDVMQDIGVVVEEWFAVVQ